MPVPRLILSEELLFTSDLPAQAYARHLALHLPDVTGTALIHAMRQLLEHGVHPDAVDPVGLTPWQAIDQLGRAAGLDDTARAAAATAARDDVGRSLFLLDPAVRLTTLLDRVNPIEVIVVTDNPDAAVALVAAVELADRVDRCVRLGDLEPAPGVALAEAWPGLLQTAAAHSSTGLLDRFGPGPGAPTWRAPTPDALFSMLEAAL